MLKNNRLPVNVLVTRLGEFHTVLQQLLDAEGNNDEVAFLEILGNVRMGDNAPEPISQFSVSFRNYGGSPPAEEVIDTIIEDDTTSLTRLEAAVSGMLDQLTSDFDSAQLDFPLMPVLRVAVLNRTESPEGGNMVTGLTSAVSCQCSVWVFCKKLDGKCKKVIRKCNCDVVAIGDCLAAQCP